MRFLYAYFQAMFDNVPNRKSCTFRIYVHYKYCVWSKSTCVLFAFKS